MIDGIPHHLRARTRCLDCRPFRPRRSPNRLIPRPAKKLICAACGEAFPAKQFVAGRMRSLYRRKFCLECSSFGSHNTSKEPTGRNPDSAALRRKKRMDSWLRYLRKRRRQRKQKLVELHGGCCEDCGYNKSLAALEFHHRNAETKDFGLGNFNGSWERLLEEAAKCDLLCANCHRIRHALQFVGGQAEQMTLVGPRKKAGAVAYMGGSCTGCNEVTLPAVLEFHHRDAKEKEFGISRDGMVRPWEKILAELAKCVMLCANCHREVHAGVRQIEGRQGLILPPIEIAASPAA